MFLWTVGMSPNYIVFQLGSPRHSEPEPCEPQIEPPTQLTHALPEPMTHAMPMSEDTTLLYFEGIIN
jgi:hypothetical protein